MNLATTISLYGGGAGSGCRGGNCGRPKLAGRTQFQGLSISLEHKAGQYRKGETREGKKWKHLMMYHYGYFRRTKAPDGDHLDVYVGPHKDSQQVFVVHQTKADGKTYDEDKVFVGFRTVEQAKKAFDYQTITMAGQRFGGMTHYTMDEFKQLAHSTWEKPRKLERAA